MDADAAKGGTGDEGDAAAELADEGGESTDSMGALTVTGLRDRIMPEPRQREEKRRARANQHCSLHCDQ
jgi:hypothetical protein